MVSQILPFGEWPSPVGAVDVARAGVRLGFVQLTDDAVWWSEVRPAEGRGVVSRRGSDGTVVDVVPAGFDARTRAHEYGGHAWVVLPGSGDLVFSHRGDGRVYRVAADGRDLRPLTPRDRPQVSTRYADLTADPSGEFLVGVQETVIGRETTHALVRLAADGGDVEVLWDRADFVMAPALSPDGENLAWMSWNHPEMPWDATQLHVARVAGGRLADVVTVAGLDRREAIQQPQWAADGTLCAVTDRSGWWNLHRFDGNNWEPVTDLAEESGLPLWTFGMRTYALLGGALTGNAVLVHGTGEYRIDRVDLATGEITDLGLPYRSSVQTIDALGERFAVIGAAPTIAGEVAVVDAATGAREVVRTIDTGVDDAYLPRPRSVTVPNGGRVVHAQVYPPCSPDAQGPDGVRPPYVVFTHGGPTGQASTGLDLGKAFFTSRGIGVVDVDYGGSTGYGREYRELLLGEWGVVDVEDCVAVARWLVAEGLADGDRLAIRGGSAGGWTTLACLTRTDVFAAGASHFGVADARALARDTHDFESRYLDSMIGPLPEAEGVYLERSPLSHLDGLSCPVLLLQGLDDKVVPPAQAEAFRDGLQRKGITHAYLPFEGEGHGFVRLESRTRALEAELSFYGQVLGFTPVGVPMLTLEKGRA